MRPEQGLVPIWDAVFFFLSFTLTQYIELLNGMSCKVWNLKYKNDLTFAGNHRVYVAEHLPLRA